MLRYHGKISYAGKRKKQGDIIMKLIFRRITILFACLMLFGLTACATPNNTAAQETPMPTPTEAPALSPEMETSTIMAEAEKYGFSFGTVINGYSVNFAGYTDLVKKEFNSITAANEMKAYSLLDQRHRRKIQTACR